MFWDFDIDTEGFIDASPNIDDFEKKIQNDYASNEKDTKDNSNESNNQS